MIVCFLVSESARLLTGGGVKGDYPVGSAGQQKETSPRISKLMDEKLSSKLPNKGFWLHLLKLKGASNTAVGRQFITH